MREKPLQTGKFVGILLALGLGFGGFVGALGLRSVVENPLLGDGQFLALVLVPLVSLGLVAVVVLETLVAGYRLLRSEEPLGARIAARPGYVLVRGIEAAGAVVGVALIGAALPALFADSTPAPAGVGIMLLLLAVGVGVLAASLVRSGAELFVYRDGVREG